LIDFLVSPAPHDRCLGDQGWYPISAILFAFQWELPERVEATSYTLNKVDTVVACSAVLFFKGGRVATFDCGVTSAHRSQFEIVCEKGTVRVDDLVGGQGRSGDFGAYFAPYVGSGSYVVGDVMGKDEVVDVEACDHVDALVKEFTACVNAVKAGGSMNPEWPRRSLAVHATMSAVFESVNKKGAHIKVRGIEI
jgi:xylose dehydrogenase (NAD/NADP)